MDAGPNAIKIGRRAALGTMGAATLGFVAFGPRPKRERSSGRIVLDYWEKWTGHEGDAMRRIVDDFNASQSRIEVRYFTMSAIDQKALIAISGGDPPDIVGLWNFNIPAYAESGAILPLDAYAEQYGFVRERYTPTVWKLMHHEGQMWGAVSTCGSVGLYYNKDLFREAGLDPESPPRTVAELDAFNEKLCRRDGRGRFERMGFIHTEFGWWSWLWGYPFGGTVYEPPARVGEAGRATAASAANIAGYEWLQSYPKRYGVEPLVAFQSSVGQQYGTAQNSFLRGSVAMVVQGPWLANMINAYTPRMQYGVVGLPVGDDRLLSGGPVGMLDADVLVVPRGAKNPDASVEFIAFTQRPENVERLATAHCKNSPLAVSSEAFLRDHPNRCVAAHDALAKSNNAFLFPYTRAWPEYVSQFNSAVERMWRLEAPAADVLKGVEAFGQRAIDRIAAMRAKRAGIGV